MAKKRPEPQLPDALKTLVTDIDRPISSENVDAYGRIQEIKDRSHRVRTIVKAWKDQQSQDRRMREQYASWLMIALAVQATLVNGIFVLMGFKVVVFDDWTARTFIMSVFGEIAALVLLVVKYLYTPSSDKILDFLDEKPGTRPRKKR